jgi:hypothetical protein
MKFSIFKCRTHEQVSDRLYSTADEANHDYHMNAGHTYVGIATKGTPMSTKLKIFSALLLGFSLGSFGVLAFMAYLTQNDTLNAFEYGRSIGYAECQRSK